MARVMDVPEDERTPEQKRIAHEIAGTRGGVVRGPFAIWLRQPDLADKANQFGNALRLGGKLDRGLFEMSILVVARNWSAQYEWFAHEEAAIAAGVSSPVVEAIRAGREPAFTRDDEAMVYKVTQELSASRDLSEPTYAAALAMFGLDLMIELVTAIGFYTMVAVVLKGFDAPVPGGLRPLPLPGKDDR
jgi:4-carboxymuconolactone decarboxylase